MSKPLLVVYDRGSASPAEIAVGLAGLGMPLAFAVADSPHVRRVESVLTEIGKVLPLAGDPATDLARVRELDPAAILTFSELMLPVTAWLAGALGLPFHDETTVALLTDKKRQRERLRTSGVESVRFRQLSSAAEWASARDVVGLPAVVKPLYGEGSRHTYIIDSEQSAQRLLPAVLSRLSSTGSTPYGPPRPREPVVLVEELLRGRPTGPYGDYVSVESSAGPHGITHLAMTGKFPLVPPFREAGRFWPVHLPEEESTSIRSLVDRALRALGVRVGLTHTEVKLTLDGPRIIEVNGRLGGHVNGLAQQAGAVDLVRLAGLLALERPPEPPGRLRMPHRVHFQHNTLAPARSCRLVAADGGSDTRKIDGIEGFRSYARIGDIFDADVMTRHLDLLWGNCVDHDEMFSTLRKALGRLTYDFEFEGDPRVRRLSAVELQGGI